MALAIVAGALANKPLSGGEAWVRLSWVLGLRRLGFDVYFVEQLMSDACVDRAGEAACFAGSANHAYFESVVGEFGLGGRAGLLCDGGVEWAGLGVEELAEIASRTDVLFNISGNLSIERLIGSARRTVYVDLDPGFTQAWHVDPAASFRLARHDCYVTVGLNVGAGTCSIPDCGLAWIATLPPVVLDEWPRRSAPVGPLRFTTVATWRSPFGSLEIGGRTMGLKHHQFRRFARLPERVDWAAFELALDIHEGDAADREMLLERGWALVEPHRVAATPEAFRSYLAASGAEFSVAQGVYVGGGSGWFSDRTAAYLACGRPVLVQDTGLAERLPLGQGLLTFRSLEDAVAGAGEINRDYAAHSAAARAFGEEHLDSDRVLGRLLDAIGVGG
jgi:hypothetical protein